MSLLNGFKRHFHDVDVFLLTSAVGSWGTTESVYSGVKDRTISGYIQPLSGSEVLKNQSLDKVTTHRMYIEVSVVLNDTDRLTYNSRNYHITYNQDNGVSNIGDHKEIMLSLQR